MYTKPSKKMLPFAILEILQRHTDEKHTLSQEDIRKLLEKDYELYVDRKSIKRNIMDLIDMGLDIQYSETIRSVIDKYSGEQEEQSILSDFYLLRDFSDCEIHLLIDEIIDSKYIPTSQRNQLISKLEALSSMSYRKRHKHITANSTTNNKQLFYTLEVLEEAISSNTGIRFLYQDFGADEVGAIRSRQLEHIVIPKDTSVSNGIYYVICEELNGEKSKYRIDFITSIYIEKHITKTPHYSSLHNSSDTVRVTFLVCESELSEFIGEFGYNSISSRKAKDGLVISINVSKHNAIRYATNNPGSVTILAPDSLRSRVVSELQTGLQKYNYYETYFAK